MTKRPHEGPSLGAAKLTRVLGWVLTVIAFIGIEGSVVLLVIVIGASTQDTSGDPYVQDVSDITTATGVLLSSGILVGAIVMLAFASALRMLADYVTWRCRPEPTDLAPPPPPGFPQPEGRTATNVI